MQEKKKWQPDLQGDRKRIPEKEQDDMKKAPYIPTREVPDPPVPNRAHTEM